MPRKKQIKAPARQRRPRPGRRPKPQPVFTFDGPRLVPAFPADGSGRVKVPDGKTIFSAQQAADRLSLRVEWLRLIWWDVFGCIIDAPLDEPPSRKTLTPAQLRRQLLAIATTAMRAARGR